MHTVSFIWNVSHRSQDMMTSLMADMRAVFVVRVKFSIPSDSAKVTVQDPVTQMALPISCKSPINRFKMFHEAGPNNHLCEEGVDVSPRFTGTESQTNCCCISCTLSKMTRVHLWRVLTDWKAPPAPSVSTTQQSMSL